MQHLIKIHNVVSAVFGKREALVYNRSATKPLKSKSPILIKKARFCLTLLALIGLFLLLNACSSQPSSQVYHVGLLAAIDVFDPVLDAFKEEMTKLGYVEGENIEYDLQRAGGDLEKMKEIAAKFVADEVDLIIAPSNGAALAAKETTAGSDIPVVFTVTANLVESGIIEDLQKPGGNMTGVQNEIVTYITKKVELLHEMAPDLKHLRIMYDPDYSINPKMRDIVYETGAELGLSASEVAVSSPEEVEAVLAEYDQLAELDFDAIFMVPSATSQNIVTFEALRTFSAKHKQPLVSFGANFVKDGALFSYVPDLPEYGRKAASTAHKVLQGADPATLPIVTADPALVLNYKTAEVLGLSIEDHILNQASEIIR